ncbi:Na+/H+ antiporter subunit E [Marinobacter sp.]|uniref:Na+/H+ antiporter subunit E n=1 Tax=Marinobacter sp. TaxID=50741 RepID=UPI003851259D
MNERFGFPRPWLSLILLITWQLLVGEVSGGSLVLGLILAWLLPLITRPLWPERPRIRKPWLVPAYIGRVTLDIVVASTQVAALVLNFNRAPRPAFISYPLTLTDPLAICTLAGTISLTPGTVSADVSDDFKLLLIHALDVENEQSLIESIRNRYEKPLQEIFS